MPVFQNQAYLTYTGGSAASNVVVGQIVEALTVNKVALTDDYLTGGEITYVVTLVNTGGAPVTGLTLTDDLGGYTFGTGTVYPVAYIPDSVRYFSDGTPGPAPAVTAGPPLTITGLTVPADGDVTLIYRVTLTEYAPLAEGGEITNTVTVTDGVRIQPITDTATVTAAQGPQLTITKTASDLTLAPGDTLTYTFLIQNYGNAAADAGTGVTLTDSVDPVLADLTVTYDGAAWAATNYTYDTTTGAFATVAGAVTVPAATYTQDPTTGAWTVTPGTATLTLTGTV